MNALQKYFQNKTCHQCEDEFFITPDGVSYHFNEYNISGIDHDKDCDHVAYCNQLDYKDNEGCEL